METLLTRGIVKVLAYSNHTTVQDIMDEYFLTPEQAGASKRLSKLASLRQTLEAHITGNILGVTSSPSLASAGTFRAQELSINAYGSFLADDLSFSHTRSWFHNFAPEAAVPRSAEADKSPIPIALETSFTPNLASLPLLPLDSHVSLESLLQGRKDYRLQKAKPSFTDATGFYYHAFFTKLHDLNSRASEGSLCIENFLVQSENDWLNRFRGVMMRKSPNSSLARTEGRGNPLYAEFGEGECQDQFALEDGYRYPTGLRNFFLRRIGEWPVYSFFLAFVSSLYTKAPDED